MKNVLPNYKKRDTYAELITKLNDALNNEYYYEAIFIEYAILEDRFESVLRHAGVEFISEEGIMSKIKKVKRSDIFKNEHRYTHLPDEELDRIIAWCLKRNDLIHALADKKYTNEEVVEIACDGNDMLYNLKNKISLINNYNDKHFDRS